MSVRALNAPHWVYRCFDESGRLIYVGRTMYLFARLEVHRNEAWWAHQVANVKAVVVQGVSAAQAAETAAIRNESPRWNVAGRWFVRDTWTEENFRDFVYAALRHGHATLQTGWIADVYTEYERRFGTSMRDPRIDSVRWVAPTWKQYHSRPARIEFVRTRHLNGAAA